MPIILSGNIMAARRGLPETTGILADSTFEGAPVVLDLPTDHPRPAMQTFRGAHAVFTNLPQELAEA